MPIAIRIRRRVVVGSMLAMPSLALEAQRLAPSVDVGASAVRYADSVGISATTFTPTLRIESGRTSIAASGTVSSIASGGWSTHGGVTGSTFLPLGGRFHGELAASAGGSAHEDHTRTGQLLVQGRTHFIGSARGLWLGGGLGTTWDDGARHRLTVLDAGGWVRAGSATILLGVAPTSVGDIKKTTLRYTDATAAARWVGRRTELVASLGTRVGDGLPTTSSSTWGSVSAALWVTGPVALTASAGVYPIDYTQGYAGGRFASVALRLSRRPAVATSWRFDDVALLTGDDATTLTGPIASFAVGRSVDGTHRTITVDAATATSVEISGDFTGWRPVQLTQLGDGRWTTTLPIPLGTHEVTLRVDGGDWIVPPGLAPIRDEFGGMSGLLVVRD